nr:helix-turn-helix domain-containing protein [Streptomyces sp. NBC_00899]
MDDLRLIQMCLGRLLTALRTERGWTLATLEAHSGVSRSMLSRFERAETAPTTTALAKICAAYGCTMSALLTDVETLVANETA